MKNRTLALIITICLVSLVKLYAQEGPVLYGIGIDQDFAAVPINIKHLTTKVTSAGITFLINEHVNVKIYQYTRTFFNKNDYTYYNISGLNIGCGYSFYLDDNKKRAIEPYISLSKSYEYFTSLMNIDVSCGVNAYLFKSFFVGTGVRHSNDTYPMPISVYSIYTWYWKLGFQLYLNKH